jgi:hypothetical protein
VRDRRVLIAIRLLSGLAAVLMLLAAPVTVAAHGLSPTYQSPLPLAVYLVGAGATVALSFVFVLARDVRGGPADEGRVVSVPAPLRIALRLVGLTGWLWILAQALIGGTSAGDVATLFLWVFGWVGIAMVSALLGPIWEWLDPFATLHDMGAWILARLGIRGWQPSPVPAWLRTWPAVAGIALVVWIELVQRGGPATLTVILVGYTLFTLTMMAEFGRDGWRAHGETFTVWFRLLGRLAPYALVPATAHVPVADAAEAPERELVAVAPATGNPHPHTDETPESGANDEAGDEEAGDEEADPDAVHASLVRRRPFAGGLFESPWTIPEVIIVALGTGSIIFDGLSQTEPWVETFGRPGIAAETLILAAFLGLIAAAAVAVARLVSPGAIGAGLLPIAVGYLVAHYLTYLLIDGQRFLVAISDPFQMGWDLFGTAFHEPSADWLPPGLVWTVQLAAVVGGHMLGAWAGHAAASRDAEAAVIVRPGREPRDLRHRRVDPARFRSVRMREVPLAVVMVALTTLTLWSLGQVIVTEEDEGDPMTGRATVVEARD